jgi:Rieske Fe-S protein
MELMQPQESKPQPDRRYFFKQTIATAIGIFIGLLPVASGLAVFLDPLRRKTSTTGAVLVTTLDALPTDGVPRKFTVVADRVDAWNKFSSVPVGAVYLRRTSDKTVEALNVVCPHAGGFVDYSGPNNCFICPLHNSKFALDGKISDPKSPSPRAMDTLEVEIRDGKEVWVKFQNYQAGKPGKIPVA